MISKLHYITQGNIEGYSHAELAEFACKGGVSWVQLRVKDKSEEEVLAIAKEVKKVCDKYGAKFIINDYVKVAKEVEAHGVHLGKTDMDPVEARIFLGEEFIIGGTANTLEDVGELILKQVDYVGLGPYKFTETKENLSPILGKEGFKKIVETVGVGMPIIAIGGIQAEDVSAILRTGVYGVAVASIVNAAEDKSEAAKEIIKALNYG